MNLSIQCPVSNLLFNDGESPPFGSSCWSGKVLMSSFFLGMYIIGLILVKLILPFLYLMIFFFLNASSD